MSFSGKIIEPPGNSAIFAYSWNEEAFWWCSDPLSQKVLEHLVTLYLTSLELPVFSHFLCRFDDWYRDL
jgi:hypothetical protein